jgi:hypothetical protein
METRPSTDAAPERASRRPSLPGARPGVPVGAGRWETPAFEVYCLACEISAYAPDGGEPLF